MELGYCVMVVAMTSMMIERKRRIICPARKVVTFELMKPHFLSLRVV